MRLTQRDHFSFIRLAKKKVWEHILLVRLWENKHTVSNTTLWKKNSTILSQTTYVPAFAPSNYDSRNLPWRDTLSRLFIVALFPIENIRRKIKCTCIRGGQSKLWHVHTMYYSAAIFLTWGSSLWADIECLPGQTIKWAKAQRIYSILTFKWEWKRCK